MNAGGTGSGTPSQQPRIASRAGLFVCIDVRRARYIARWRVSRTSTVEISAIAASTRK